MVFIDLPRTVYEFELPGGLTIKTSGCSLAGKTEFQELLERINLILSSPANEDQDMPAKLVYLTNQEFQSLCKRALELNFINPDPLTYEQIDALLLQEEALLIAINLPPSG